ncbi:MAG: M67 family metallopeptidase [Cyanobacteria bacterium P01_A01_bin.123]
MLILTELQRQTIRTHAIEVYPQECCGLLLGTLVPEAVTRQVEDVVRVENTWSAEVSDLTEPGLGEAPDFDRRRRYWIDPKALLQVQREARDRGLNIIGVYHSHPDHPAVPSECDRRLAWSDYSYIIVSVEQGHPVDLKSWCLDENQQFVEEAIAVDTKLQ